MKSKIFGALLIILGTCIGAGMLALPIVTAQQHVLISLAELVGAWLLMTFGAFALLEVNLGQSKLSNMVTMAGTTLGPIGQLCMWFLYLLLLYALLCAYIAATSGVVGGLLGFISIQLPDWANTFTAVSLLSLIVAGGIYRVDLMNRGLMSAKLLALVFVCLVITPYAQFNYLRLGGFTPQINAFFVMITSFGFAIIVPSLRVYFEGQPQRLKRVVLLGSLLPLVVYTVWIILIQSFLPRQGEWGLIPMMHASQSVSQFMGALNHSLPLSLVNTIAQFFISISAVTSFLGVSLSMTDFLADGLRVPKQGKWSWLVHGLAFVPPTAIVLFKPSIFITALNYAGLLCMLLLVLMPTLMAYRARYSKNMTVEPVVRGGRLAFWLIGGLAVVLTSYLIWHHAAPFFN